MQQDRTEFHEPLVVVGEKPLSIGRIVDVAVGHARVGISRDPEFVRRMGNSVKALNAALERGEAVYGVTTGFGGSCGNRLSAEDSRVLGDNLIRYHGCGTGELLGEAEVRAAMLCRAMCLAGGYSAVSIRLLEQLAAFLNEGITPCVPSEGSVGASGDLTPMSYVAAALAGRRHVFHRGRRVPAEQALESAGLAPIRFSPKEPLAVMNGTSIMTGIAVLSAWRARSILDATTVASALSVHALMGHVGHFHETLFRAKPFAGQARVAARLRELLAVESPLPESTDPKALQDPYSIRCAPHVMGVLADALDWIVPWIETEANSANDNPLIDPASGQVLVGGNFYGGHIALAMDALKIAVASMADMADRQVALMVDERFSRGLPDNLVVVPETGTVLRHGFKGVQIAASALTAEAQKLAMPATVFSRSTETHNQDKVSLGTIAARDANRMCTLAARVSAMHLLVASRACRLRGSSASPPAVRRAVEAVERIAPAGPTERPMDVDIENLAAGVLQGTWMAGTHGG